MAPTWAQELVQQGRREGIQKGMQKGRRDGLQKGRQEGELAAARDLLLTLLVEKFGPLPEGIELRVRANKDQAQLKRLVRQAIRAGDLAELDL